MFNLLRLFVRKPDTVIHPNPKDHPIGTSLLVGPRECPMFGVVLNWSDNGEFLEFGQKSQWYNRNLVVVQDTVFKVDPLALQKFVRDIIESFDAYAGKNYRESFTTDVINELELGIEDIDSELKKHTATEAVMQAIQLLSIKWSVSDWSTRFKSLYGNRPAGCIAECGTLTTAPARIDGEFSIDNIRKTINTGIDDNTSPPTVNAEEPKISETGPMLPLQYPPKDGLKADVTCLTKSSAVTTITEQVVDEPKIIDPQKP